jgi:hypothetical protein
MPTSYTADTAVLLAAFCFAGLGLPPLPAAAQLLPVDAGTTVKCKFVNDRKIMTLKLQKAWVNGHAGDTAELGKQLAEAYGLRRWLICDKNLT